MKKTGLLLMILFFGIISAQEIKKEIEVKKATVYLRGAKVFGTANLNLSKGKNVVKITNLPNDLDENTYKINLEKGVTLLSVTPQNNYLQENELSENEKNLDAERKKIQREIDLFNIQLKSLNGEQNIINNNLKIAENDKVSPQEQLIKLTQFYAKRMLELDNSIFIINEKKQVLEEKIGKINQQFAESQTHKNINKKELLLEIFADNAQNFDLGVSYVVQNAGWIPSYDLRAENTKKPFEIVYKGKIYQKTGQDWKNVKLFVSTYQPNYNQNRPILRPLFVNEYVQNIIQNETYGYEKKEKLAMANSYQMREDVAQIPVATVSESQMNILYELNYTQDIYSQEKEQFVILDKKMVNAEYKHHAVPKMSDQVFLLAKVKNWQTLNLIPGEANIYFDDNFIGKTQITTHYVNDEFPISLGVDERIILKRIKLENKSEEKTLNSNKKLVETYQITVRNNSKETIDLEILDQIPLSENNKIMVKTLEIGDGKYDEKTGSVLWNRNLVSGATEKIILSYELKFPKDSNIQYYSR